MFSEVEPIMEDLARGWKETRSSSRSVSRWPHRLQAVFVIAGWHSPGGWLITESPDWNRLWTLRGGGFPSIFDSDDIEIGYYGA